MSQRSTPVGRVTRARNKECLFGKVIHHHIELTAIGQVVYDEWQRSVELRNEIELDESVIMPNHIHGIVRIKGARMNLAEDFDHRGVHSMRVSTSSLSSFVAGFKAACSSRAKLNGLTRQSSIWQRNYHEHIIRSEILERDSSVYSIESQDVGAWG